MMNFLPIKNKPSYKFLNSRADLKTIGQRLKIYMQHKHIGVNELGRLAATSGGQISHIIYGKNYGIDKMFNILLCQPDLNSKWLLFGNGPMIKDKKADETTAFKKDVDVTSYPTEDLKDELMILQSKHIMLLKNYHKLLKNK